MMIIFNMKYYEKLIDYFFFKRLEMRSYFGNLNLCTAIKFVSGTFSVYLS